MNERMFMYEIYCKCNWSIGVKHDDGQKYVEYMLTSIHIFGPFWTSFNNHVGATKSILSKEKLNI